MCSPFVRKEANRMNCIIKGKLIDRSWSDKDIEATYNSYMKRLWGNNENYIHEDGFQQAWKAREAEIYNEENDLQGIAVLGYD
jgi:hypothetical protein